MSKKAYLTARQQLRQKIQEYKDALKLEGAHLQELEKLPLDEQHAELKMLHHFAVLFAKKALRDGKTVH